jgi:hypothetical protein
VLRRRIAVLRRRILYSDSATTCQRRSGKDKEITSILLAFGTGGRLAGRDEASAGASKGLAFLAGMHPVPV